MDLGLAGKRVLVTGGTGGIGRAVVRAFAAEGAHVAFTYRTSIEAANTLAASLGSEVRTLAVRYDLGEAGSIAGAVEQVESAWGGIDVLVTAAIQWSALGPFLQQPFDAAPEEAWLPLLRVNLEGHIRTVQHVLPGMRARRWGRIVTFAMANADQMVGQTEVTAHYAAKAAVLILTRSLARALASDGITVNAISPGFIASGSAPESELAGMAKRIPAGYIGEVRDAVSIACFLVSEEARYVNGSNIHVSGAWGV